MCLYTNISILFKCFFLTRTLSIPVGKFEGFGADCKDDSIVDSNVGFPSGHEEEVPEASFQDLEIERDLQVHLASAFSLDLGSSLVAFQVFASFLAGPFVAASAFDFHLVLLA